MLMASMESQKRFSKSYISAHALVKVLVLSALVILALFVAFRLWVSPSRRTVTHSGDLIVDANQVVSIEDCVYEQDGDVVVKDNATLLIRNAELRLNQGDHQHGILVRNEASLLTERASVVAMGPRYSLLYFEIYVMDNARWEMIETSITEPVHYYNSSHVSVENSPVIDEIYFHDSSSASFIDCIGSPYYSGRISCSELSSISIHTSQISGVYCSDFSTVLIEDSVVTGGLSFVISDNTNATLRLRSGEVEKWNMYENETIAGVTQDITIMNSTISSWRVSCRDSCNVSLLGSTLQSIRCEDFCDVLIKNSNADSLSCHDHSHLSVQDSTVSTIFLGYDGPHPRSFFGNIDFEKTRISQALYVWEGSQFYFNGNVTVEGSIEKFAGQMTRNYNLITQPNMDLHVTDKETGALLWQGKSNTFGQASFNITFIPENYTHPFVVNNKEIINMTSTTPIRFNETAACVLLSPQESSNLLFFLGSARVAVRWSFSAVKLERR